MTSGSRTTECKYFVNYQILLPRLDIKKRWLYYRKLIKIIISLIIGAKMCISNASLKSIYHFEQEFIWILCLFWNIYYFFNSLLKVLTFNIFLRLWMMLSLRLIRRIRLILEKKILNRPQSDSSGSWGYILFINSDTVKPRSFSFFLSNPFIDEPILINFYEC